MANEAVCIETPTIFRRRTIAAGAVLPFGTVLELTDPNTAIASSGSGDPFGGIVFGMESTATDTFTELTVAMNGVWDLKDSGAGTGIGVPLAIGGANTFRAAIEADTVLGTIVGRTEETTSAAEVGRASIGGFF